MREWKTESKTNIGHSSQKFLFQRDVENILVALEARNEQWPISTTGWNKLVMNDAVDASASPGFIFLSAFLFFPQL